MAYPSNEPDMNIDKNSKAAKDLKSFIERIERLEEEKRGMMDDIKDVYLAVKSSGFDPKAVKKVIQDRKKEADAVTEFENLVNIYREAIS